MKTWASWNDSRYVLWAVLQPRFGGSKVLRKCSYIVGIQICCVLVSSVWLVRESTWHWFRFVLWKVLKLEKVK